MASDMDKAIQENMKFTLELADKIPLSAATSVELRRFLSPYEARSCLLDRRCENFLTRKPAWTRSKFQRQVDDEKNDLGACILMATNASWTGTKTRGHLVSEEGPAGTFSQKILLGRALHR